MLRHGPLAAGPKETAPLLGILYAEDFDDLPALPPPEPEMDLLSEPTRPLLTDHDIERACSAAVAEARRQWEQDAQHQRGQALAAVADAIASAREAAAHEVETVTQGTVATILSMVSGALPSMCRHHGPAEVRALVGRLLPNLQTEPRITIRVHPGLVPMLEEDLASLDLELTGTVAVTSAALEPGDVRVAWENGSFKRDTRAILASMQDALAQLGLLTPIDITQERRMELAE